MSTSNVTLAEALKLAKTKTMYFAFIPGKGEEGRLIVSKRPIPPQHIAEAKKEIGGRKTVTGTFVGSSGNVVFQVVDIAPAGLSKALKKIIKRDTGLTIVVQIQLAGDGEPEE